MPPLPILPPSPDALPRWLWLALSLAPHVVLFAAAAWLWRSLVRTRCDTARRVADTLRGLQEVTRRQAAELEQTRRFRAFAAERLRLRAILDGMLDPLAILEPVRDADRHVVDFSVLDVNPAACSWLEVGRDHLVGARLGDAFREFESSGLLRALAALAETGRPLVLDDFPFLRHGVAQRRLDVRGIRGDEWISLVWRDVTERHDMLGKLADSEEHFRLLAENSTDVIVWLDTDDMILWISPSVTSVLGWTPADGIGRRATEFLDAAENRARYARDKARALGGRGAVSRAQVCTKSGDVHWMEIHSFPYRTSAGVVSGMVASLHPIDEQVRMEQELERRARIDMQTGLLTRRVLLERLEAAVGRREPGLGLLWCDIDGFKGINDAHGHATGDAVLEALGERIRGCLRSADDIGGRIAGDELIVALRGLGGLDEAVAFAEALRCRAAEPIATDGGAVGATISVGVTLAGPGEDVDAVLARADDAMYEAKARGKNRVFAVPPPAAVRAAS
jgi:diguanylate cyclase (GGDEF)-like protein/PAS domain S-box-containing protein